MKRLFIYQIRKDVPDRHYKIFEPYDRLCTHYGTVDLDDYYEVYSGFVDDDASNEDIFQMFNINRPDDFKGHSLSVSDIIEVDDIMWYCNDIGWVKLDWDE